MPIMTHAEDDEVREHADGDAKGRRPRIAKAEKASTLRTVTKQDLLVGCAQAAHKRFTKAQFPIQGR